MATVFQIIKNTWNMINSAGQYMGLFLVAFIFLFVVDNKKNRMLFSYCLLALILVFNPFTANNLMSFYIASDQYWYVFLLLPVIGICAYCFVEAVTEQRSCTDRVIVFISLILIALIAGRVMNQNTYLQTCENRAYISDEYLQLFQEMNIEGESVVLLANDDIMENARAYSQYIGLPYEVPLINSVEVAQQLYGEALILLHGQMQQPSSCLGNITTTARNYQCNYLILPLEADERWEMEYGGYEVLKETENYVLYHDLRYGL